ncbi:hypothetical protein BD309DRAFT_927398 [Dichomitus squalens]|nr:hypothetical protein BD309DRAFT_927398 [Dichomitus squalens]
MPALRHSTLASSKGGILHGVRWRALKAVLSLPQLTEISLSGLLFSPLLPDYLRTDDLVCPHLQHIKTFRYEVPSFRVSSWGTRERYPFHSEEEMLCRVLERLRHSVEMLALSSEPAPIQKMAQWRWPKLPKLRELKLAGERWAEPLTPVVSLFATMPHLRKLVLELTLVRGQLSRAPPLWPRGYSGAFPWPNLTHLSLSHPHPEDELFANLPSALRSLSLCCHPHKWQKLFLDGSGAVHHRYKYVVLDSSKMLVILSRCQTPQLTHLELEYNADEGENDLLRYLAASFPLLTSLQVHRYRAINNPQAQAIITGARTIDDVNFQAVDDFGRSLSELMHLRTLSRACRALDTRGKTPIRLLLATLHRAAGVLSRAMSDAVRQICLWRPRGIDGYEWLVFHVVCGELVTGLEVRCEEDLEPTQR